MSYKRRLYELINLNNGTSVRLDGIGNNNHPRNWDDAEKTIKRSLTNYSITTELSKNLEFTGSGAEFLRNAYLTDDIEAKVKMYEYRFNPTTDVPYIYSIGDFDFSDYKQSKTTVSVPFNSGGLNALLKAKLNDKFEITRTTSINGDDIGELKTYGFERKARPIFLTSELKTNKDDSYSDAMYFNGTFQTIGLKNVSIPLKIIYESDDKVSSVIRDISTENLNEGLNSFMFYLNSDIAKSLSINIKGSFTPLVGTENRNQISNSFIVVLAKYENGETPTFKNYVDSVNYGDINDINGLSLDYNFTGNVDILKGESLALLFQGNAVFNFLGVYDLNLSLIDFQVNINEFSSRSDIPTLSKCVLNKDKGDRLMSIITGETGRYYSEFFNSSEFKLTGGATGKWIRGFLNDSYTTSLKNFLNNCKSVYNMGYNIEVINGKEVLVHEPLKHFFRQEVGVSIPIQVSNVERKPAKEFIFSTIKTGYKKPDGDNLYEEVNGLNEYNTKNEYITPINRIVKEYDIQSPYRADSEGKELTARQHISINPTGDYRTDNTIFNLDLKESGTDVYEERVWQDDYEEAPKNIFSPDTATGLRLTPYRNMSRHFWFINNAFTKFRDKFIRYSNTIGNSDLITKKVGEEEIQENGDYQINTLENPIFVSQWITFEYKLDFNVLEQLNGYTEVNGRKIPNTYFKVEFINEFNEKEYGYLFELKPEKEGKWKVLKAL